jgi:tagatose 6-phosphate kinase
VVLILTVTLNPSLDKWYPINEFEKGKAFMAKDVIYTPGGSGLNVAKVIKSFNEPVMAAGFSGGRNGEYIEEMLDNRGIDYSFISINEETRNFIAIISADESRTEISEIGPSISGEEVVEFYELYKDIIGTAEIICISGNLPRGLPSDTYRNLIIMAKEQNKKVFFDANGEALRYGIEASPFLVKQNRGELEELMGFLMASEEDIERSARYIMENGVELVIVSLGSAGSMFFYDGYSYNVKVPNIKAINAAGSGDAMLAGFAVSLLRDYDFEYQLKVAAACGTANAMEIEAGKVDMANMKMIMNQIEIEKKKMY